MLSPNVESSSKYAKRFEHFTDDQWQGLLDVNLNGAPVTPVVEILVERGVPFIFASGYGQRGLPEAYRTAPILQKPFQADALEDAIKAVANGAN